MAAQIDAAAGRDEAAVAAAAQNGDTRSFGPSSEIRVEPRADADGVRRRTPVANCRCSSTRSKRRCRTDDWQFEENQMKIDEDPEARRAAGARTVSMWPPHWRRSRGCNRRRRRRVGDVRDVAMAAGFAFTDTNGASPRSISSRRWGRAHCSSITTTWLDRPLPGGRGSLADPALTAARVTVVSDGGPARSQTSPGRWASSTQRTGMGACAETSTTTERTDVYTTNDGPNVLYRNAGKGVHRRHACGRCRPLGLEHESARSSTSTSMAISTCSSPTTSTRQSHNRFCGDSQRRIRVHCHPLVVPALRTSTIAMTGRARSPTASVAAGLEKYIGNGLGVAVGDDDDDGRPDVFVANDSVPNFLVHERRRRPLQRGGCLLAGVAVAARMASRERGRARVRQPPRRGRLDLVVTNHEFERPVSSATTAAVRSFDTTLRPVFSAPTPRAHGLWCRVLRSRQPRRSGACRSSTDT